jgi:hypothetical protein
MTQNRKRSRRKQLRNIFVWHGLRASSPTKRIDGLWIGIGGAVQGDQRLLDRVEEALALIKRYDRLRYDRLSRDLKRVWVHVLHGIRGSYNEAFAACELDARFVLPETTSPELIAATIVHEATHSRLLRCGIGYEEAVRARVEAVCLRRELAFAAKLPNGAEVKEVAEHALKESDAPGFWSDTQSIQRRDDRIIETLRQLGVPDWLVRGLVAVRALQLSIKKQLRRR